MTIKRPSPVILILLVIIGTSLTFLALNRNGKFNEVVISSPYHRITPALLDQMQIQFKGFELPPAPTALIEDIVKGPLPQDHAGILSYIRNNNYLFPPSKEEYNLAAPNVDPSMGQSSVVKRILKNMENGFFVECGALDGETRSNTLDLEKNFGWKGLLVEGDPKNFEALQQKNRKAWLANACLATKPYPHQVLFKQDFNVGKISQDSIDGNGTSESENEVRVQCFPLFSLLSAMNVTQVDYFSLDVEGHEYQVLQTIPFHKLKIKVLSVEYIHGAEGEGMSEIERFMGEKGYRVVTKVTNGNNLANDIILVHESVEVLETIEPIRT